MPPPPLACRLAAYWALAATEPAAPPAVPPCTVALPPRDAMEEEGAPKVCPAALGPAFSAAPAPLGWGAPYRGMLLSPNAEPARLSPLRRMLLGPAELVMSCARCVGACRVSSLVLCALGPPRPPAASPDRTSATTEVGCVLVTTPPTNPAAPLPLPPLLAWAGTEWPPLPPPPLPTPLTTMPVPPLSTSRSEEDRGPAMAAAIPCCCALSSL
mmetsp:Transcript_22589/g.57418  ORF Transcript_22589/g.57418 Transcript_22589/m.57418 type:complete len:213 (+) Transcript_22589:4258-4896(+)